MSLKQTPVFVVSSGRAGSTLLSSMINRHPRILCVSDIFEPVGDVPYFDRQSVVSGASFFEILSRPSHKQRIRYWREQPTDELLFLHEDDEMVSLLLSYTLPFLVGSESMNLFHELKEAAAGFGQATMADHLIRFFEWLRDRFGKELWVERTGGSLPHIGKIITTWPGAKLVHSFRDPRETAISMMTGSFFRLYLELTKNPDLDDWDCRYVPPLEEMGALLNRWMMNGLTALDEVPEELKLDMRYEDLVEDTVGTLLKLSRFIFESKPTPTDIAWAEAEVSSIRRAPLRFRELPAVKQERLEEAVRESIGRLGYSSSAFQRSAA